MSIIDKLNINNGTSDYELADSKARADISTINGKLTTDEAGIKTNASNISAEITRAKAAEKVNSDNIATNKTNIATNKTNIDKNKASIDNLTSSVENNTSSINSLTAMMNFCRTDKVYSIDIPKWSTTQASTATKTDANAGLVALPSTSAEYRQNDYDDLPWFKTFDVNAVVDNNGVRTITAVKGDDNFSDTEKDVFVCGMSYYEKLTDLGNGYIRYSRTFYPKEGFTICPLCVNRDGSTQPYFLIAKYMMSFKNSIPMSIKNARPAFYTGVSTGETISMNNSITHCTKKGKFYSLSLPQEMMGYITTTWWLMFANINSDNTMTGVTGYSWQYTPAVTSSEKHNYFVVTSSQAGNIDVGSYVSVGMQYVNGSSAGSDRYNGAIHKYAFDRQVLKKETLSDGNVAIYVDCDPFATTPDTSGSVTLNCIISSMYYWSGFSDNVKGRTGCPCPTTAGLTNRHFPIVFNGIEMQVGLYEVEAGFSIYTEANTTQELYSLVDASKATTSPTQNQAGYKKISTLKSTNNNNWNYISEFGFENGCVVGTNCGASGTGDTKGVGDAVYISTGSAGNTRELLCLGFLGAWSLCGLCCLDLSGGLGSVGWLIGGHLSLNAVGGVNA